MGLEEVASARAMELRALLEKSLLVCGALSDCGLAEPRLESVGRVEEPIFSWTTTNSSSSDVDEVIVHCWCVGRCASEARQTHERAA